MTEIFHLTQILILVLASGLIIALSWRSLKNPSHHGFYRFFAFESILLIIVLNLPYWLGSLKSPLQFFSGILLLTSLYLVISALSHMKTLGGKRTLNNAPENHNFENTANLIATGMFKYIRHPMYSSLLFLTWGALLKHLSGYGLALAIAASFLIYLTAKKEEHENTLFFGNAYNNYMQKTKMFIPFIY